MLKNSLYAFVFLLLTQYSVSFYYSHFSFQSPLFRSGGWWRCNVRNALKILPFCWTDTQFPKKNLISILNGENIMMNILGCCLAEPKLNYWSILLFNSGHQSQVDSGHGGTWQQYLPIFDFLNGFPRACTIDQSPNIMSVYPEGGTEVDWFYPTPQNECI